MIDAKQAEAQTPARVLSPALIVNKSPERRENTEEKTQIEDIALLADLGKLVMIAVLECVLCNWTYSIRR